MTPVSISTSDGKAIDHGSLVGTAARGHVVAVVAVVGEVRAIIPVQVAAEDADVGYPIPLVAGGLPACKAAVERHAVFELEGSSAVGAGGGLVGTRRHPDFVAAIGSNQGGL